MIPCFIVVLLVVKSLVLALWSLIAVVVELVTGIMVGTRFANKSEVRSYLCS